jgi:hypothetical protein
MDTTPGGTREPLDYQSYLLRLWRDNNEEKGWRASLESAQSGERKGFADLDALFDFLRRQTAARSGASVDGNRD